jgi:hypothetical protein
VEKPEENKLKALNDILKGGKDPFAHLKKEDEEEFDMFIKKLNEKNIILSEERKAEVIEEPESPVKRHRGNHPQTQILDQSSIQGDYSQLTGAFEDPSPVPPPL